MLTADWLRSHCSTGSASSRLTAHFCASMISYRSHTLCFFTLLKLWFIYSYVHFYVLIYYYYYHAYGCSVYFLLLSIIQSSFYDSHATQSYDNVVCTQSPPTHSTCDVSDMQWQEVKGQQPVDIVGRSVNDTSILLISGIIFINLLNILIFARLTNHALPFIFDV